MELHRLSENEQAFVECFSRFVNGQIKGDTPHTGFPDIGMYHKTVGIGDVDYQLFPKIGRAHV